MTPVDLLIETGERLYGHTWTNQLADDLGVSDVTVRYWTKGKMPLRPDHPVMDRLVDLIDLRMVALNELRLKFLNPGDVVTLVSGKNSRRL